MAIDLGLSFPQFPKLLLSHIQTILKNGNDF